MRRPMKMSGLRCPSPKRLTESEKNPMKIFRTNGMSTTELMSPMEVNERPNVRI